MEVHTYIRVGLRRCLRFHYLNPGRPLHRSIVVRRRFDLVIRHRFRNGNHDVSIILSLVRAAAFALSNFRICSMKYGAEYPATPAFSGRPLPFG